MGGVKLQRKSRDFTFLGTHGRKLHFFISIFFNGQILLLLSNSAPSLSSFGLSQRVCKTRLRRKGEEEGNMRNRGEEGKKEERKGKGMCVRERERKRKGKERKE
jgi:hypothetical protein